jgi:hypothetical protein
LDTAATDKPELTLEFHGEGQLAARGHPELPSLDGRTELPCIANTPVERVPPGHYEVQVQCGRVGKRLRIVSQSSSKDPGSVQQWDKHPAQALFRFL